MLLRLYYDWRVQRSFFFLLGKLGVEDFTSELETCALPCNYFFYDKDEKQVFYTFKYL